MKKVLVPLLGCVVIGLVSCGSDKKDQKTENEFIYKGIEEKIKMILGTKVTVNHKKNNKGRIEIEYYSNEELERIMDLLESIHQET